MAALDFEELKYEYTRYYEDLDRQDIYQLEDNSEENQNALRSLMNRLEKSFPKKPSEEDSYLMYHGYLYIYPDNRTEEDHVKWLAHTKRYINSVENRMKEEKKRREKMIRTPRSQVEINADFEQRKAQDKILNERLSGVITYLPEISNDPETVFNYTKKAYDMISPDYHLRVSSRNSLEKSAENFYNSLIYNANYQKDDVGKLKLYEKALTTLLSMAPIKRIPAHRECFGSVSRIYQKSESGRQEIGHKQSVHFSRVWKSLPLEVQSMYRNNSWRYK